MHRPVGGSRGSRTTSEASLGPPGTMLAVLRSVALDREMRGLMLDDPRPRSGAHGGPRSAVVSRL